MHAQSGAYVGYLFTTIAVGLVLFLRLRRMGRVQRLRLERLWIVPALYLLITAMVLRQSAPGGIQWLYLGVAMLVGAAVGWRRGKLMRISIDPETHELNQQASPAALLFILLLIAMRLSLRVEAARLGFNAAFLTDLLVVSALGLLAATRLEMFLRARQMLADAPRPSRDVRGAGQRPAL